MIAPADHFCDVGDLEFGHLVDGIVYCFQCQRMWTIERCNGAWRMEPRTYGNWRTLPGNRFVHRLTGEIVEGPPLPASQAERLGPEMANGPELALRPAQSIDLYEVVGGNDTAS